MSNIRELWRTGDRASLFVLSLVLLLVLLVIGLVLADQSLRRSTDEQALVDATTSARIVAQEVELVGERLHELGTNSAGDKEQRTLAEGVQTTTTDREPLRAVWLLNATGTAVVDSTWLSDTLHVAIDRIAIQQLAHHVAASGHLQLQGLPGSTTHETLALLGEPVIEQGAITSIAIALVDERQLLAPAGSADVEGRSFLALLVDSDTVQTPHRSVVSRRSSPVRVPLPGQPAWFVISGQASRHDAVRMAIWVLGSGALVLLLFGLIRERRQTARIAERSVELERLSAELLRANRMKSEFLANVSHELRTPLNAIVGFVDLLRDGGYGELSERQKSPVERVATSAARLRALVDQVLDVAKIAAGRVDVRLEALVLRPFLLNVVSEIEPLLTGRGLEVEVVTAVETPKVRTDPTHLRQILINLLGNAAKYTNSGRIILRTRVERVGPPPRNMTATGQHAIPRIDQAGGWLVIDVVDTGIGIAASDLERIFEEFEQAGPQSGGESADRGTGLGLAISRRLATLLGGDVSVESVVDVGSTFSIWLPLREDGAR